MSKTLSRMAMLSALFFVIIGVKGVTGSNPTVVNYIEIALGAALLAGTFVVKLAEAKLRN